MKKKLFEEVKKNERGSVKKEKRSRMREKRKRAMQTYIHTWGQCQSHSAVCLLARRHYHYTGDVVVFFSNHNRLRMLAHSHQKFSTSLFLRRIIITKRCLKETHQHYSSIIPENSRFSSVINHSLSTYKPY